MKYTLPVSRFFLVVKIHRQINYQVKRLDINCTQSLTNLTTSSEVVYLYLEYVTKGNNQRINVPTFY
jgi:hypothetical protein